MVGEDGGSQAGWWLGGEEAQKGLKLPGGEQAMEVMGLLLLCRLSEVRSLENMASASGKLGGVAGVLLGVHICRAQENGAVRSVMGDFGGPNPPTTARPITEDPGPPPHPRTGAAPKGLGCLGRGSSKFGKDILDHPRCSKPTDEAGLGSSTNRADTKGSSMVGREGAGVLPGPPSMQFPQPLLLHTPLWQSKQKASRGPPQFLVQPLPSWYPAKFSTWTVMDPFLFPAEEKSTREDAAQH